MHFFVKFGNLEAHFCPKVYDSAFNSLDDMFDLHGFPLAQTSKWSIARKVMLFSIIIGPMPFRLQSFPPIRKI